MIFKFLKNPSELFPTQKPIQPFFLELSCSIVNDGSSELLTNTFTIG